MKTSEGLLKALGIQNYTHREITKSRQHFLIQRHLKIVNDFIESGEKDVKKLLNQLK